MLTGETIQAAFRAAGPDVSVDVSIAQNDQIKVSLKRGGDEGVILLPANSPIEIIQREVQARSAQLPFNPPNEAARAEEPSARSSKRDIRAVLDGMKSKLVDDGPEQLAGLMLDLTLVNPAVLKDAVEARLQDPAFKHYLKTPEPAREDTPGTLEFAAKNMARYAPRIVNRNSKTIDLAGDFPRHTPEGHANLHGSPAGYGPQTATAEQSGAALLRYLDAKASGMHAPDNLNLLVRIPVQSKRNPR